MRRYSPPNFTVWAPPVQVVALLNESDIGSKSEPVVVDALVARMSRPLRAMPVLPRASIDDDVKVPESDTPSRVVAAGAERHGAGLRRVDSRP